MTFLNNIKNKPTAVWRKRGLGFYLKLVLCLDVWSLIYTFVLSNPRLTPSRRTLADIFGERIVQKISVKILSKREI